MTFALIAVCLSALSLSCAASELPAVPNLRVLSAIPIANFDETLFCSLAGQSVGLSASQVVVQSSSASHGGTVLEFRWDVSSKDLFLAKSSVFQEKVASQDFMLQPLQLVYTERTYLSTASAQDSSGHSGTTLRKNFMPWWPVLLLILLAVLVCCTIFIVALCRQPRKQPEVFAAEKEKGSLVEVGIGATIATTNAATNPLTPPSRALSNFSFPSFHGAVMHPPSPPPLVLEPLPKASFEQEDDKAAQLQALQHRNRNEILWSESWLRSSLCDRAVDERQTLWLARERKFLKDRQEVLHMAQATRLLVLREEEGAWLRLLARHKAQALPLLESGPRQELVQQWETGFWAILLRAEAEHHLLHCVSMESLTRTETMRDEQKRRTAQASDFLSGYQLCQRKEVAHEEWSGRCKILDSEASSNTGIAVLEETEHLEIAETLKRLQIENLEYDRWLRLTQLEGQDRDILWQRIQQVKLKPQRFAREPAQREPPPPPIYPVHNTVADVEQTYLKSPSREIEIERHNKSAEMGIPSPLNSSRRSTKEKAMPQQSPKRASTSHKPLPLPSLSY